MKPVIPVLILLLVVPILAHGEYLNVYEHSFDSPLPGRNVYRVMVFNNTIALENTLSEEDVDYCEKCPADTTIYNVSVVVDSGPFKLVYKNYSCPFSLGPKEKVYLMHEFYVPGPVGPDSSAPLGNYTVKYSIRYWVWEWRRNNVTRTPTTILLQLPGANNTTYNLTATFYNPVYYNDNFTVKLSFNAPKTVVVNARLEYLDQKAAISISGGERRSVEFRAKANTTLKLTVSSYTSYANVVVLPKYVKTKVYYAQELIVPVSVVPRNISYILTSATVEDKWLRVQVGLPPWPRWTIGNYTLLNVSIGQYLAENITVRIQVENLTVNGSKLLFYHTEPSISLKHEFHPLYNNESITLTGEVVWDLLAIHGAIMVEVEAEDDVHGKQVFTSKIPLYCNCSWLVLRVVDDYGEPLQGVEVLVNNARFLTGPSGTIYYLNRPPGRCLNATLGYGKYRLHVEDLCPVTILERTVIIDTHSPEITYKWNPWNRFLTVSVSDRTRIRTVTIAYGSRVVNYTPMTGNYTIGIWIPKDYNGTVTVTAEDIYNNTNTIVVKVGSTEEFRLGLKESIILTVLAGTLAFLAHMARRMKLI